MLETLANGRENDLLHVVDRVRGLHLQSDGLARQGLDENLHIFLSIY